MAVSFKGGLKTKGRKAAKSLESKPLLPCEYHLFVLNEHKGAPVKPVVHEGEYVLMGEKIADADEYTALPVHSSVSGMVREIKKNESGQAVSILIQNDKLYSKPVNAQKNIDYENLTDRERLWIIRDAGISDMDNVPVHLKLAPSKEINYLVINGAESNPNIAAKCRRIIENTEDVMNGIKISMDLLKVKHCTIGIEKNMRECINVLKPLIRYNDSIDILKLKARYPQDNGKIMIKTITGRSVRLSRTAEDIGTVCLDIETVYNIGRVFRNGMPVIERMVTVGGDAINENDNFIAPIGVSAEFLFNSAGGFRWEPELTAEGGIMNGKTIISEQAPVTRTTDAFFAVKRLKKYEPQNCVRCGQCASVCPMGLMPNRLNDYAEKGNTDGMIKYHVWDCIECGLCTYVCPSRIDILGNMKKMSLETDRRGGASYE